MILTNDGSYTLKNSKYNECYHSKEGAVTESLYKHIYPALEFAKVNNYFNREIKILDICYGLGYNSLLTILNRPQNVKLKIYSPEMDKDLVKNLIYFPYPKEFKKIKHIIESISKDFFYEDEHVRIEIFIGNAREYIKKFEDNFFDVIYQDAFSPKVNKELWTIEYFKEIKRILNNGLITTYSVATPVRCALYTLKFNLYTHTYTNIRKGTIGCLKKLTIFDKIDFEKKLKQVKCYYYEDNR